MYLTKEAKNLINDEISKLYRMESSIQLLINQNTGITVNCLLEARCNVRSAAIALGNILTDEEIRSTQILEVLRNYGRK